MYANNDIETLREIPNFPKNTFHLIWPGELGMAFRTGPISPKDNVQLAIAKTISNINAFKFEIREYDRFNKFDEVGFYKATIRIVGTFDGIGVTKRIEIVIHYEGGKEINIIDYRDIQEE
jgi:hypothetical protein